MAVKKTDLMKLVVAKCMDCCCDDKSEVKACTVKKCPLFPVRLGLKGAEVTVSDKPKRKRKPMSEAHKEAMRVGREAAKAAKK